MDETPVVTCFLRNRGDVLLLRRSDAVGSYDGLWGAVAGHVADDRGRDRSPEAAALAEIEEETGLESRDVSLVRAGASFPVDDPDRDGRWVVHPFLFDCESRVVETNEETTEYEWTSPTDVLRRETVPALWTSYDRVRPRVATVHEDRERGSAWLSLRAIEVLRDEAALAVDGRRASEYETREVDRRETATGASDDHQELRAGEADGDDWEGLAALARELLAARPSMAVVANRVNRVMAEASGDRTPAAVEAAAIEALDAAKSADDGAAANAAERLPERVATLSRSGTVLTALREAGPDAVLVAESRPGREGVRVAEALATSVTDDRDVTLTSDAAFPFELDARDVDALVVGADRVLPDGRVVNKVGTRAAALGAPEDCDCYVVAASAKVATDQRVDLEERDAAEVYDGDAPIAVANPTFDVVPADAVDAVITEDGALDADEIAAVAERHRERADWG